MSEHKIRCRSNIIDVGQQWEEIHDNPFHTPVRPIIIDEWVDYVQYRVINGDDNTVSIKSQHIREFVKANVLMLE